MPQRPGAQLRPRGPSVQAFPGWRAEPAGSSGAGSGAGVHRPAEALDDQSRCRGGRGPAWLQPGPVTHGPGTFAESCEPRARGGAGVQPGEIAGASG